MKKLGWTLNSTVNLKAFSLRLETGQGFLLSPLLFNVVLKVLVRVIWQEKDTKAIQIRKEEVKFPLFADDVILYVANAEDSRKKKKKTVRKKFQKVGGSRLTHKNQLHLYILTDQSEKKITKQLHLLWYANNK